jgi:WXXGXW repeat (2 copies)
MPGNLTRFPRTLLLALLILALTAAAAAGVFVSVTVAPPPLPVYVQPACPGYGYMWIPGYWAWGPYGYYWVPGTWVLPPEPGLLWTPGYWGWDADGDDYIWNGGYWGPTVGFYGGINYGFGYFGVGFAGGYWRGRDFYYNRAVWNVRNVRVTNVYENRTVIRNFNTRETHVSFHGPGGIQRAPDQRELAAGRERHFDATASQIRHRDMAQRDPNLQVRNNRGRPPVAATARPGEFTGRNAVRARAAGGSVPTGTLRATPQSMPARTPRAPGVRGPAAPGTLPGVRGPATRGAAPPTRAPAERRFTPGQPSGRNLARPPAARATPERNFAQPRNQPPRTESRPTPQREYRPAPQSRPQYRPAPAPQREARPAPQREYRPAPQREVRPAPAPRSEYRPAPQREARPAPQREARPAPQREARPAPRESQRPEEKRP